ncbi:hypothetical protein MMC17_001418 [Xylographa soralifera]|nr:hypothetical protein [Xylographa soralifera]
MKYALVFVASTLLVPSTLAVNGPKVLGVHGAILNPVRHTRSEHGSIYGSMQEAPLLRRDADAEAEAYFEERAAYANAYAFPEAAAIIHSNGLSRINPATLDRTTTSLGRRSAKSTSSGASKSGSTKTKKPDRVGQVINNAGPVLNGVGSILQGIDGLVRREITLEEPAMPLVIQRSAKSTSGSSAKTHTSSSSHPDRVGQVLNNAGPVLNGVGSIIQGIDGLVRRELILEENTVPLVYQRSAKSTSSGVSKSGSTKTKKPDRVGQVLNNAGPVLNGVGSIIQGIDGLVRRELILEENTVPLVHQRSAKFTSSSSAKTHTSSSSHPDRVGQVLNNAAPVLNGVGSIIQGIDGLVRRDLTIQEAAMLHARSLQAHRRYAKTASTKSTGSTGSSRATKLSTGSTKPQSSVSKPKPNTSSSSSHPDRVGQVINNAGPVLSGIGSIVQGIDGLVRRDLTREEIAFLNARDLQAAANRRRSFSHILTNQQQNKVTEFPRGSRAKRDAEPTQLHRPKHLRRSASVGSYFQPLERDVENIASTVVAREAEAEAARDMTIKPNSTTTTTISASGNQVVNTVSISDSAKNGTSAVEAEPKKKTTKEKEESERKHPKELKAKEDEKKEEARKGKEHRTKEQRHREKLQEEKIAKEKAEIKKLGKTIKEMNSTATAIKETSKQNSTANNTSAKKADLNAKPVPSIPAQVAKVAARAAEIVRGWTGLNE